MSQYDSSELAPTASLEWVEPSVVMEVPTFEETLIAEGLLVACVQLGVKHLSKDIIPDGHPSVEATCISELGLSCGAVAKAQHRLLKPDGLIGPIRPPKLLLSPLGHWSKGPGLFTLTPDERAVYSDLRIVVGEIAANIIPSGMRHKVHMFRPYSDMPDY